MSGLRFGQHDATVAATLLGEKNVGTVSPPILSFGIPLPNSSERAHGAAESLPLSDTVK